MISMRYHLVSLAAAFLALAVGVVLGATAISDRLLGGVVADNADLTRQAADLRAERDSLRARATAADTFGTQVAPAALRGQLDGRGVVLVTTADADQGQRESLVQLIAHAGGRVTGEVMLTDSFVDPDKADQLRELVPRLLPSGASLPVAAPPGALAGALLGRVMLTGPDGKPRANPEETTAALTGMAQGGFLRTNARPTLGTLVVTLVGPRFTGADAADRAATVARFTAELDRAGAGAVLAGPSGSAEATGAIGIARSDNGLSSIMSTVDNTDTVAGRVVTVLALREQLDGRSGGYGTAGNAGGVVPQA